MYYRIIIGSQGSPIAKKFKNAFDALRLLIDAPIGAVLVEEQHGNRIFISVKKDELLYSFNQSDCGEKNKHGFQEWQQTRDSGYYAIEILKHTNDIELLVFKSQKEMENFDIDYFLEINGYYPDDFPSGSFMIFIPKDKTMNNPNGSVRLTPMYTNPEFTLKNMKKHFSYVVAVF